MTSHVHLIIGSETNPLAHSYVRLQNYTSRMIRLYIEKYESKSRKEWMLRMMKRAGLKKSNNKDWQCWQQHSHLIELFNTEITKHNWITST